MSILKPGAAALLLASTALSCGSAWAQDASNLDELVVVGQRLSQQRSIDVKRDAEGISDAISADEIGRLPDKNAAENLERLPGVSLKYDQGEGRYVSIRGVDGALNNVTVNGVQVGSPEPGSRNLPMDVLGGQLTSRIEVIKAVTPDLDGQGIGGTVNLVTQSPFDFNKPFFAQGSAAYGAQQLNDKHPFQGDATLGALFGANRSFGVVGGVNYSDREYRTFGLYPDDWRPVPQITRGMPTNIKFTTYELHRQRLGLNGGAEYRPTDEDKFYVRGFYSSLKEHEYRQRYRLDFASNLANMTFSPDGRTGVSTAAQRRQDLRLEQKDKTVFTSMLGGENTRGDWKLDYNLSYGDSKIDDHDQNWQFRGAALTTDFDMGPLLYKALPRVEAKPSEMLFNQFTDKQTNGDEESWSGVLNARRSLDFGRKSYLKFGFKYRDTERTSDNETPTYGLASGAANRFSLADFNLLGSPTFSHLGDGVVYPNNPTISPDTTPSAINGLIGSRVVLNTSSTLSAGVLSDFGVKEKVAAGYAMASLDFGKLTVLGGLRIEDTRTDATGKRLTNGTTVTPVGRDNAYTNLLPNLQLRYEPSETMVLRAAFTNTVGRPEFSQISPTSSFSFTTFNGRTDGGVSEGNPDLKPYLSWNFDGSAEWYFSKGGLLSVGAFYKRIENPIFTYSQTQTGIVFQNLLFDTFSYSQPRNATRGSISGVELNYQQQFRFLPGPLAGFGVAANLTLTDSSLRSPTRTDELTFPRQSKSIYGAQLFYQKYGFQGTLSYHWASHYLDTIGATPETDTFFNSYTRVDAKLAYAITPKIDVFIEGQNLNDEVLWEYQGGRPDWQIGYERYGRTVYLGVTAKW